MIWSAWRLAGSAGSFLVWQPLPSWLSLHNVPVLSSITAAGAASSSICCMACYSLMWMSVRRCAHVCFASGHMAEMWAGMAAQCAAWPLPVPRPCRIRLSDARREPPHCKQESICSRPPPPPSQGPLLPTQYSQLVHEEATHSCGVRHGLIGWTVCVLQVWFHAVPAHAKLQGAQWTAALRRRVWAI